MLWSLIKILFFLTAVIVITLGAVWLLESKGGVTIEYAGFELSFGALQAAILGIYLPWFCGFSSRFLDLLLQYFVS